jgi:hypothetical protein
MGKNNYPDGGYKKKYAQNGDRQGKGNETIETSNRTTSRPKEAVEKSTSRFGGSIRKILGGS